MKLSNSLTLNPESVLCADAASFESIALQVFQLQYERNPVYRSYCDALHIDASVVDGIKRIPFLPISFFKTHRILTGDNTNEWQAVFESSGTTAETPSRHYVRDMALYERSLLQGFGQFYGAPEEYAILALLPSYLERKNASLVHMARVLMEHSGHEANGFYINEWERLQSVLTTLEQQKQKTLLLGVTFALLDFAAACPMPLAHTIVMETGGMKGRREELTRTEVHTILEKQWQLPQVHSEYGMTELLSQAYAIRNGIFRCGNTMRVLVRDINDPLDVMNEGAGGINMIDLANIHSCSFIATEDLGTLYSDGSFEVLGRMDHSALRGCSLMVV